jgi:outer membrane immunogenic protein
MKLALLAAAAVGALIGAPAIAQPLSMPGDVSPYGSIGYSQGGYDDVDLGAVTGRLGLRFGRFFGVEGEASFGVAGDDVTVAATNVDVDLNHDLGIYAVGFAPLSPSLDVFGRIGYGTTDVSASAGGFTAAGDDESFNYGAGTQYFFDGANGVRGEYTRKEFNDGGDADVWSLAYTRRF